MSFPTMQIMTFSVPRSVPPLPLHFTCSCFETTPKNFNRKFFVHFKFKLCLNMRNHAMIHDPSYAHEVRVVLDSTLILLCLQKSFGWSFIAGKKGIENSSIHLKFTKYKNRNYCLFFFLFKDYWGWLIIQLSMQ